MELSIIIPVYNAQKYLKECLDSVTECCIKEMECILVNDGSNDLSVSICQSYMEKDDRFKLIHRENGGVSAARNSGIEAAVGKYILFLDADDYMEKVAWSDIAGHIKSQAYDFTAYSYYTLHRDGRVIEEAFAMEEKVCMDLNKIRNFMLASSCLNTCWGKLFLLKEIIKNKIRFRTELKIGEDFIFVADYFQICTTAILHNKPVLYYRQHATSVMGASNLDTRLEITDILFSYNKSAVLTYEDDKLLSDMYTFYLRIITNLLLVFSKGRKINKLIKVYRKVLQRDNVKEIVFTVKLSRLPYYKRVEGILLKKNWFLLLAGYFKIKSCLMH